MSADLFRLSIIVYFGSRYLMLFAYWIFGRVFGAMTFSICGFTNFSGNDNNFFRINVQHLFVIIHFTFINIINIFNYHKYRIIHINILSLLINLMRPCCLKTKMYCYIFKRIYLNLLRVSQFPQNMKWHNFFQHLIKGKVPI